MFRVDENIINLLEKIRRAIRNRNISASVFPMDELNNLIECTLGDTFWKCVGSKPNEGFKDLPEIYKECLQKALEKEDMEECERILRLFESSYMALYTALNEDERIFRQRPYRKMIIELGSINAQMQYRIHKERQKGYAQIKNGSLGKGRGVVYTYLDGEQELQQPEEVSGRLEYLCFTDKKERWNKREGVWKYCPIENTEGLDGKLLRSKYKIMAHQFLAEYDYSIWTHSNMQIVGDVLRFCEVYGEGKSFLGFSNTKEDCIYEDMSVAHVRMDDLNIDIRKKLVRYEKEGYPANNGLIDGRVMVRDHRDKNMCRVMEEWWREIQDCYSFMGSVFNYIAWKNKFPFSICNLFIYTNPYFRNSKIDLETNEEY